MSVVPAFWRLISASRRAAACDLRAPATSKVNFPFDRPFSGVSEGFSSRVGLIVLGWGSSAVPLEVETGTAESVGVDASLSVGMDRVVMMCVTALEKNFSSL